MSTHTHHHVTADQVKAAVTDWPATIVALTRIDPALLDGKNHPCPKCGGTDRFSLVDRSRGAVLCRHCFNQKNGDGVAALQWLNGWTFPVALEEIAKHVGLSPAINGNGKPNGKPAQAGKAIAAAESSSPPDDVDDAEAIEAVRNASQGWRDKPAPGVNADELIAQVCREKKIPDPQALRMFGAVVVGREVFVPMFGPDVLNDGNRACSIFIMEPGGGKGRNAKGMPAGVFMPTYRDDDGRLLARPTLPGQQCCLVEGVKDAAALVGLRIQANGMPGAALNEKFAPIYKGVHVVAVPDRDNASLDGAKKTAARLQGIAASFKVAHTTDYVAETKGDDVRDVLHNYPDGEQRIRTAIAEAKEWTAAGERPTYRRYTMRELVDGDFELEYIVRGMMTKGEPMLVAGPPKGLKTNITLDLALSLATATPFLGEIDVPRACRVGVMSGESGESTIRETLLRIARAKGVTLRNVETLIFSPELPRFDDPAHHDALTEFIEADKIEVVVVDPAYLAMIGADATQLLAMGKYLRAVNEVVAAAGAQMVLLHHTRKANRIDPYAPLEFQDVSGTGFTEHARQWLLINRREEYDHKRGGEHRLWMLAGGSAGHSGLWAVDISEGLRTDFEGRRWEVSVKDADEARQERRDVRQAEKERRAAERLDNDAAAVLRAAAAYPDGETKNVIRTRAGLSGERFNAALAKVLASLDMEETTQRKANGKTYTAYRLTNQTEDF